MVTLRRGGAGAHHPAQVNWQRPRSAAGNSPAPGEAAGGAPGERKTVSDTNRETAAGGSGLTSYERAELESPHGLYRLVNALKIVPPALTLPLIATAAYDMLAGGPAAAPTPGQAGHG